MNGKGGSSLGTLLFSVPLAAIPLMAIFGIPQFAPLVASPERSGSYDRHPDDRASNVRLRGARRHMDGFDDELADSDAPAFDSDRRPPSDRNLDDRYDRVAIGRGRAQRDTGEDWASAGPDDEQRTDSSSIALHGAGRERRPTADVAAPAEATAPPAAAGLTWKSAAERLQELGITSYHLEPGANPTSFLFVCSFCPAQNPNVTMRFESEAADPLVAVDDVLAQIDRWQQTQSSPQP
jgi:hypothetical protein